MIDTLGSVAGIIFGLAVAFTVAFAVKTINKKRSAASSEL
jgi:hypothetical protein